MFKQKVLKSTLFITFLLTVSVSYSQITTTKVTMNTEEIDKTPYDGTINFLGKDVHKYIGEDLYLNGKNERLQSYGYEGFLIDYTKKTIGNKSNIYKCCNGFNSNYSDLQGKYFTVLDVLNHPEATNRDVFFLKLQEKESKDIVYFEYKSRYEHSFPFITVKYFTKNKETQVGKEFILRGKKWATIDGNILDIYTGKPIVNFNAGDKWTCIDVSIEEKYYSLSMILKNKEGEHASISLRNVENTTWLFPVEISILYEAKFGKEKWLDIVSGKVSIGMTKEMCELSWGKPKNINKTITSGKRSEQWVYSDNYLYFDNGILTTIQ